MGPPLGPLHILVLKAFYDLNSNYLQSFNSISHHINNRQTTVIPTTRVRTITRFLKRRGYVYYTQAFREDDFLVCGSGHAITNAGVKYIDHLIKQGYFS